MTPKCLTKEGANLESKAQKVKIYSGVTAALSAGHIDFCDALRNPEYKIKGAADGNAMFMQESSNAKAAYNMFTFMSDHTWIGDKMMGMMMRGMKMDPDDEAHNAMPVNMEAFTVDDLFDENKVD